MKFEHIDIIKEIQSNIICPICKRHFLTKEIKIKSIIENIVIFQVQCANNHQPVQSIHIALMSKKNNIKNNSLNKLKKESIKKQIDNFDGDFIKLWKK